MLKCTITREKQQNFQKKTMKKKKSKILSEKRELLKTT